MRLEPLYVVLSGRVRVLRHTPQRFELLHFQEPGGILGEIPVFGGGEFTLGVSQAPRAEELGTAREVVVRAIAEPRAE